MSGWGDQDVVRWEQCVNLTCCIKHIWKKDLHQDLTIIHLLSSLGVEPHGALVNIGLLMVQDNLSSLKGWMGPHAGNSLPSGSRRSTSGSWGTTSPPVKWIWWTSLFWNPTWWTTSRKTADWLSVWLTHSNKMPTFDVFFFYPSFSFLSSLYFSEPTVNVYISCHVKIGKQTSQNIFHPSFTIKWWTVFADVLVEMISMWLKGGKNLVGGVGLL